MAPTIQTTRSTSAPLALSDAQQVLLSNFAKFMMRMHKPEGLLWVSVKWEKHGNIGDGRWFFHADPESAAKYLCKRHKGTRLCGIKRKRIEEALEKYPHVWTDGITLETVLHLEHLEEAILFWGGMFAPGL